MDSNPVSASVLLTQQRRSKQQVPDKQKDDSYWQKRLRNNIAAKKSRENKRQYECMVRSRLITLEEENCLLKKELEVLKERFNIPKDAGVLSSAERDECLIEWRKRNSLMQNSVKRLEGSGSSFDASDFNDYNSNSPCDLQYENSRNEMKERATTPVSTHVWAITPAHSKSLQRYAESSKIYRSEVSEGSNQEHSTGYKRKRNMSDDNYTNADDKANRNPCTDGNARDLTMRSLDLCKTANDSSRGDQSEFKSQEDDNIPVDLSRDAAESDNINSDIKNKLQLLSDQVERMQKLVCNV